MKEEYLVGLAAIVVVGFAAQWIAWRLRLPSILLLLVAGIVAGPVTGFLNPDELFGDLLTPVVAISVGIILFEGGLGLDFRELKQTGGVVTRLVTMGALVTWALATAAAFLILRMDFRLALLLGAVLVVTGPTVIIPLLNYIRPKQQVSTVIRWEGILIDPVGALLAVLVYEAILAGSLTAHADEAGMQFLYSIGTGMLVGLAGALLLFFAFRHYLIPDNLQNPFSLAVMVTVFAASNHFQPESGLLATTVMGVALANQRYVALQHIVEFKENLRVLVISSLFILLAARLTRNDLAQLDLAVWGFLAVLVFVVRPAAVWVSAVGSKLSAEEREFVSWMAPRGIVAAAVASLFADKLVAAGIAGAERLAPITFFVIITTVMLYGLTAFPVAKRLGLAEPSPQGVLFVGAHNWAREIAQCLKDEGFEVALADSNRFNVRKARLAGLPTYYGGILSEHVLEGVNLYGIGKLLALTSNDEANSLASLHFADVFGRKDVYQLPPDSNGDGARKQVAPRHLSGRYLFGQQVSYDYLASRFREGARLKCSRLSEQFGWKEWREKYGEDAIPMFVVNEDKELTVATADHKLRPRPGDVLIALVKETETGQTQAT